MQRIAEAGGLFISGNPATNTKGTVLTAEWANAVQEEIARTIELAGIPLSGASNEQLKAAISALVVAAFSSKLVAANGYQALPGGVILQWGTVTVAANNVNTDISLPIAFLNAGLQIVVSPAGVNSTAYAVGAQILSATTARFNCQHSSTVFCRWFAVGS